MTIIGTIILTKLSLTNILVDVDAFNGVPLA